MGHPPPASNGRSTTAAHLVGRERGRVLGLPVDSVLAAIDLRTRAGGANGSASGRQRRNTCIATNSTATNQREADDGADDGVRGGDVELQVRRHHLPDARDGQRAHHAVGKHLLRMGAGHGHRGQRWQRCGEQTVGAGLHGHAGLQGPASPRARAGTWQCWQCRQQWWRWRRGPAPWRP